MPPQLNASKPNSRARRRSVTSSGPASTVILPAAGCEMPIPKIPAGREWSRVEKRRWNELWTSPQATQWDETASGTVALLVSYASLLLSGQGAAWIAQECRHASEALGLTPRSLLALNWQISDQ